MILGIGIDIVEVDRFNEWQHYSHERLQHVFSSAEIAAMPAGEVGTAAEYCASRFAAKEAFFKALSSALVARGHTQETFSFAFARQHVEVVKGEWGVPQLCINWQAFEEKIGKKLPAIAAHLSLAHERSCAVAIVVLELLEAGSLSV